MLKFLVSVQDEPEQIVFAMPNERILDLLAAVETRIPDHVFVDTGTRTTVLLNEELGKFCSGTKIVFKFNVPYALQVPMYIWQDKIFCHIKGLYQVCRVCKQFYFAAFPLLYKEIRTTKERKTKYFQTITPKYGGLRWQEYAKSLFVDLNHRATRIYFLRTFMGNEMTIRTCPPDRFPSKLGSYLSTQMVRSLKIIFGSSTSMPSFEHQTFSKVVNLELVGIHFSNIETLFPLLEKFTLRGCFFRFDSQKFKFLKELRVFRNGMVHLSFFGSTTQVETLYSFEIPMEMDLRFFNCEKIKYLNIGCNVERLEWILQQKMPLLSYVSIRLDTQATKEQFSRLQKAAYNAKFVRLSDAMYPTCIFFAKIQ